MSSVERTPLVLPASFPRVPPADFVARLEATGAVVSPMILEQLGAYLGWLLSMNEHMNLTGIKDPNAAWERHVFDALTLLPLLADVAPGSKLVDIGSGGGIPGIPLALARPDLSVTLVEATKKKAAFLEAVADVMHLSNVSVRSERAEHLATRELTGCYDVVTARAVARLKALVPLTVPFARPGGLVLLIKGQQADEELAEARGVLSSHKHRAEHEQTIATPTGRIVKLRRIA